MALDVAGLSHGYALKPVLENIELRLAAGQRMALVGPSGCGKTTLLHLCAGLSPVQNGSVRCTFRTPACVFQQPRLLPWKHAADNIALGLKARGMARRERPGRVAEFARRLGLSADDLEKYPHQLSGGMQSRVALARALILAPDLLLLDEPFAALDIGLKSELYRLLLQQNSALLMITHDLMEAVRLADTLLVMAPDPGRIAYRTSLPRAPAERDDGFVYRYTAELLQRPEVRHSFGLPVTTEPPEDGVVTSGVVTPLHGPRRARRRSC